MLQRSEREDGLGSYTIFPKALKADPDHALSSARKSFISEEKGSPAFSFTGVRSEQLPKLKGLTL